MMPTRTTSFRAFNSGGRIFWVGTSESGEIADAGCPGVLYVLAMLREIRNVEQMAGEPPRRWFFSHEQDLLMWFGDDGAPVAFQLSYGKYRDEHAIRWKAGLGFTHYRVDDGEKGALTSDAPLLIADGVFDARRVGARFRELSAEMPRKLADFVAARLEEYSHD